MLNGILSKARSLNALDGITGALICRHDVFLQMLEGPLDRVEATFERIRKDDRHVEVNRLWSAKMENRLFGRWGHAA